MKPGEGKAHRACAIRCIAGGIPPVSTTIEAIAREKKVNEYVLAFNRGITQCEEN